MTPNNQDAQYTSSQTVTFTETQPAQIMEFIPTTESTSFLDSQPKLELNKFFERPTLIQSITWGSGGVSTSTFYPWTDFLTNAYIENKLKNYALFRGDLHVKVVVSANPFTYGAALLSYVPVPNDITDSIEEATGALQNSQKPHIWIFPQNNAGGELVMPFFYKSNYADIRLKTTSDNLGKITFEEVIALDTANDVAIPDLAIQVYAWCTNVYIAAPTTQLILQVGKEDEYKAGPVERVATKVAGYAAALTSIPIIEPFAIATSLAAGALAGIASLFGWSKAILIEGARGVLIKPYLGFASSEVSNVMDKLALDQKTELSVDPRIVNLTGQDELALNYLLQKEAYVCNSNWLDSDAINTQLFEFPVWPMIYRNIDSTTYRTLTFTPMAYFATLFTYWRGDIIFRFRLVASQYHRGRIKITYEPKGQVGDSDYSNIAITKIVDITEQNDIEFVVPYMQEHPWCKCILDPMDTLSIGYHYDKTGSANHYNEITNGTIRVQVLTTLSSPQAISSCHIIAYVRGGENLEVAVPSTTTNVSHNTTHLDLQVGSEGDILCGQQYDKRYLINHGEQIVSMRQVLSRASLSESYLYWNNPTADWDMKDFSLFFHKYPNAPGYNQGSYLYSEGILVPESNHRFCFSLMHPINWVSACFAACRGGIQVNFAFVAPRTNEYPVVATIYKLTNDSVVVNSLDQEFTTTTGAVASASLQYNKAATRMLQIPPGTSGLSRVVLNECSNLSAELPDQHIYLYNSTRQESWLRGSEWDDTYYNSYRLSIQGPTVATYNRGATVEKYMNIAPDFNVHFFLCTPTVYYSTTLGQGAYDE
jgi:hypothetical protein